MSTQLPSSAPRPAPRTIDRPTSRLLAGPALLGRGRPRRASTWSSSAPSSRPCSGPAPSASPTSIAHHGLDARPGRRGHRRGHGRPAHRPLRPAQSLISSVAAFSVLTIATGLAAERHPVHHAPLPGRPRARRLPADRAGVHERARRRPGRGGSAVTRMMTGYHVGAVLTALLALKLVDAYGWESMFFVGGVARPADRPADVGQAARVRGLPARRRGPRRRASPGTLARSAEVVKGRYLRVSIGLWVASFMGLLLVYGLNTWLPTIMGEAGYSIKAGTTLLLVLNLGAVIGLLVAGQISDARGNKPTVLAWFGLAAVFLALLSIKMESSLLVYVAVLLAGIFVFSAQVLVYAFVGHLYPPEIRGTALGCRCRRRPGRRDRRPVARRRPGDGRDRLPVGLLHVHPRRRARRAGAGDGAGARARQPPPEDGRHGDVGHGGPGAFRWVEDWRHGRQHLRPRRLGDQPGARAAGRVRRGPPPAHPHRARRARRAAAAHRAPAGRRARRTGARWRAARPGSTSSAGGCGTSACSPRCRPGWSRSPRRTCTTCTAPPSPPCTSPSATATEVLYLDRLRGHASVPIVSTVGSRLPMHATGVGKVLLAHAPADVQQRGARRAAADHAVHDHPAGPAAPPAARRCCATTTPPRSRR